MTAWECPEDVLIWFYKAGKCPWGKDFCMNIILLKLSPKHNRLTTRKEGIRITDPNWIARLIYFFHQKFYQILFDLYKFNKFLSHHNCLILQQNWLYIERKSLSSAMTTKQWKFSMLYWHYYVFFPEYVSFTNWNMFPLLCFLY